MNRTTQNKQHSNLASPYHTDSEHYSSHRVVFSSSVPYLAKTCQTFHLLYLTPLATNTLIPHNPTPSHSIIKGVSTHTHWHSMSLPCPRPLPSQAIPAGTSFLFSGLANPKCCYPISLFRGRVWDQTRHL
ncbi:hypothetical protein BCR33DRAFT_721452 [Rhizoclosmatium globosum]|uniref:Uncharacterized protein n=1 Tax=Rhizoclosmatium globosum TaxID=329046 RepID=A0A1Y2BRP2_9FUNG|nr:hypothetical protein BCR33DRAFT_721452 [Rhizoclosmatium globosum]|eukprot:ORY37410.1 hypothetical protein BCR33DRAFT_721452 [Rhizoclosmatium globosum]